MHSGTYPESELAASLAAGGSELIATSKYATGYGVTSMPPVDTTKGRDTRTRSSGCTFGWEESQFRNIVSKDCCGCSSGISGDGAVELAARLPTPTGPEYLTITVWSVVRFV